MNPEILVKTRWWSPREILKSFEARVGPTHGRLAGGWIHDLCSLRKVVLLCAPCNPKFDPKKLGYIRDTDWPRYGGKCDGCGTWDGYCTAYYYEPEFLTVRSTADERRALARSRRKRIQLGYL